MKAWGAKWYIFGVDGNLQRCWNKFYYNVVGNELETIVNLRNGGG